MNLPGYSPDFNADEAVWGWAREEATGNLCLGSRAAVQERVGNFLAGLSSRKDEVRRRCRTLLQSRAETLPRDSRPDSQHPANAHPNLGFGLGRIDVTHCSVPTEVIDRVSRECLQELVKSPLGHCLAGLRIDPLGICLPLHFGHVVDQLIQSGFRGGCPRHAVAHAIVIGLRFPGLEREGALDVPVLVDAEISHVVPVFHPYHRWRERFEG